MSRTQLIKVPCLNYGDIKKELIGNHNQTEAAASEIAYLSNGNMTEALAMLQHDTKGYHMLFVDWLRLCFANKGLSVLTIVDQMAKMGRENQKNFLRYGTSFLRECCLLRSGAEKIVKLPEHELETARKMSAVIDVMQAEVVIGELEKAHYHIERNANPKILFLDVSLQIIKVLNLKIVPPGNHYIPN